MSAVPRTAAFDPRRAVRPARVQLGLRRCAGWGVRGLLVGGLLAVGVLGAGHIVRLTPVLPIAVALLATALVTGVAIGIARWPGDLDAARAVDRYFRLHDRVTTALELRESDAPLASIQRSDAAVHLQGLLLRRSARGQMRGRESVAAALIVVVAAALALAPMPSAPAHSQTASSDQLRVARAAQSQVPAIAATVNRGLSQSTRQNTAIHKLNRALSHLRLQLMHTHNRAAALRAISATQQQLRRIASSLHPINPAAVTQLNRALASHMSAAQQARSSAGGEQSTKAAASTLNQLASQIPGMSPSQQASLARSLATGASNVPDTSLRASLRQAASSLAYHDPQSAAAALHRAASAVSRSHVDATAQSRLGSAASSLDPVKQQVSGLTPRAETQLPLGTGRSRSGKRSTAHAKHTPGKSGNGSGKGRGNGSGSGTGTRSSRGSGSGQGSANPQSSGSGNGGTGGTGGHGIGGGRGGVANHGVGRFGARVYIPPVRVGKGSNTVGNGPNGAPLPGSIVPYQQVLGRYQQTARAALDRSALPPSVQTYVRRYFTSISH